MMPESHFLACIHPRTWFVVKCFSFFLAAAVLSVKSLCVRRAWRCRHAVVYPGVCGDYVIGEGGAWHAYVEWDQRHAVSRHKYDVKRGQGMSRNLPGQGVRAPGAGHPPRCDNRVVHHQGQGQLQRPTPPQGSDTHPASSVDTLGRRIWGGSSIVDAPGALSPVAAADGAAAAGGADGSSSSSTERFGTAAATAAGPPVAQMDVGALENRASALGRASLALGVGVAAAGAAAGGAAALAAPGRKDAVATAGAGAATGAATGLEDRIFFTEPLLRLASLSLSLPLPEEADDEEDP